MLNGVKGYLSLKLGRISVGGEEGARPHVGRGLAQRPGGSSEWDRLEGQRTEAGGFAAWD